VVRPFAATIVLVTLGLACARGALQPVPDDRGGARGGPTAGTTGSGGAAGEPPVDDSDAGPPIGNPVGNPSSACPSITTGVNVINPCGRTNSLAFSPDGALLAMGTEAARPNVHLWRLADGARVRDIDGVGGTTYHVEFSPDGKLLAAAGGYTIEGALGALPEIVKLWNVADGSPVMTIPASCGAYASSARFSHDGQLLVTSGMRGPVEIWRVADGALMTKIEYGTTVHNARFSPDDKLVILGGVDQRATVWTVDTGELKLTLTGTADEMADAAFSPDGREIATTGANNSLALWNATSGAVLQTMAGHNNYVSHVLWMGSDHLISNDWGGTVRFWMRDGRGNFAAAGFWSVGGQSIGIALSPDQTLLVAGGSDPVTGAGGFVFLPF